MRLLVCGSRNYDDKARLFSVLDKLSDTVGIEVVIEGCAKGADQLAEEWATSRNVTLLHNPADWGQHGRAAGPIRNREMLKRHKPTWVMAFYKDRMNPSRGTQDMVNFAVESGVATVLV